MKVRSLSDFRGPFRPSGDQLNYQICPVCGTEKWKVFINPETGAWICFAGGCGAKGVVDVGLDADGHIAGQQILDMMRHEDELPVWEEVDMPPYHELTGAAKRYLKRRGVPPHVTQSLGLVEWEGKCRILFPYFDFEGNLIYWNSRRYSERLGDGPKYLTAPGKHPLYWLDRRASRKLVIVEGVMDAIMVRQAGFGAVALGGKSLPRYLANSLLTGARRYETIDVMLDPDALDAALRLRASLSDRADVRVIPLDDKDPGDMSPEEIKEILCTSTT